MKKIKQPGENISLKTKKNEFPQVMEWINIQSNLMDSIRYLVENEIREHGVRNLQLLIPAERGILVARAAESGSSVAALPAQSAAESAPNAAREAEAAQRESAAAAEPLAAAPEAAAELSATAGEAAVAGAMAAGDIPQPGAVPAAEDDIDEDDIDSWM